MKISFSIENAKSTIVYGLIWLLEKLTTKQPFIWKVEEKSELRNIHETTLRDRQLLVEWLYTHDFKGEGYRHYTIKRMNFHDTENDNN